MSKEHVLGALHEPGVSDELIAGAEEIAVAAVDFLVDVVLDLCLRAYSVPETYFVHLTVEERCCCGSLTDELCATSPKSTSRDFPIFTNPC